MRVMMGDNEKAVQALEEGLRRGIFYGLWDFTFDLFQPLQKEERFQAFWKRNLARIEEAQSRATMKLDVVTPAGYDPAKSYPLFVALHGGGGNLTEFEPAWKSPRLRAEFITAYVQSSQVADMAGFHWQDEARTRRDLEVAFQEVVAKHAVDRSRVLVGGFSSGGFASLAVAFHQFLPVRGFVALCPEVPASIADGDIVSATKRSLRGTLLTTELDHRLDQQRALAARLTALGLENEIVVTPNTGHWYPNHFEEQLDQAIARILTPTPGRRDAGR
jgi:acetyl esterase/lipase